MVEFVSIFHFPSPIWMVSFIHESSGFHSQTLPAGSSLEIGDVIPRVSISTHTT